MKKLFSLILVCIMLFAVLVSCGDTKKESTIATTASDSKTSDTVSTTDNDPYTYDENGYINGSFTG